MKALILTITLQILCIQVKSQVTNLLELFKKIDSATQQLTSGQFKLNDSYTKVSIGEDSSKRFNSYDFYFKSNPLDTLLGHKILSLCSSGLQQAYNGNELLTLTLWDKTLEISPRVNNHQKIKQLKLTPTFFPLPKSISSHFQQAIKYQGLEKWNSSSNKVDYRGQSCYKFSVQPNVNGNTKIFQIFYVSADNFIPIGQEIIFEKVIAKAKEIQTFEIWISDFKPNVDISDLKFDKETLSGYNKELIVDEKNENETNNKLLKKGSISPDWELPLINGGTLKLSDLKGKVVVLDFWYKACAPCQEQMVDLQQLHDKFGKDKVVFVGVNTKDHPIKDKLALFLRNRNLTMAGVYNGNKIEKLYNVYASPALFIINGDRRITFSQDGYSNTLIKDVITEIEKLL